MTTITQAQVAAHAPDPEEYERRIPMTYQQFLLEVDESTHAEWVNGEAIFFMPPTPRHQEIVGFLFALLREFAKFFQLGQVFTAPVEMKIAPDDSGLEPDVLFVATAHLNRIADKKIEGVADLVVEVMSNSSVRRDRAEKFYEYEEAGVREYWLIDPRQPRPRADFWVLDSTGRYQPAPVSAEGIYHSTVLADLWINVNWLWQEELPDTLSVFAQIVGPDRLIDFLQQLKRATNA